MEKTNSTKTYVNLRIDEVKLKAVKGLSTAFSRLFSYLLVLAVFIIVLGLLAIALLQWLNGVLGAPFGTLAVAGFFIIVLAVLVALREKLFRNSFVKPFIDTFFGDEHKI